MHTNNLHLVSVQLVRAKLMQSKYSAPFSQEIDFTISLRILTPQNYKKQRKRKSLTTRAGAEKANKLYSGMHKYRGCL